MNLFQQANRLVLAGLLGLLLLAGISCSSPTSTNPTPSETTISMAGDRFTPETITIRHGTTVTWVNDDEEVHTATSDMSEGGWNTGDIMPGGSRSITFHTPGTYPYHCTYHVSMGMRGTIIVQ